MTDRGLCMGLVVVVIIGHAKGRWGSVYVWGWEHYAEMRARGGGWKQNRTALTTEPKDKEKIGLADRKGCSGAWSCYMKGDRKRTSSVWQPKALWGKHITETSPSALSTIGNNRYLCVGWYDLSRCLCACVCVCPIHRTERVRGRKSSGPSKPCCTRMLLCKSACVYMCEMLV